MKRFKYILLFCCLHFVSLSQVVNKTDRIKTHIATLQEDSNKVNAILSLSIEYLNFNNDSAQKYALEALTLSEKLNDDRARIKSLYRIGVSHLKLGNQEQGVNYFIRSLNNAKRIGDRLYIANNYKRIGSIYQYQNDYQKALDYQFKGLKILLEMNDSLNIARTYDNIGISYRKLAEYDSAFYYSESALALNKILNKYRSMGFNYNNIASIYLNKGDYKKAKSFYLKSLNIREKHGKKSDLVQSYNNLGNLLIYENKHKEAIPYFTKAITLSLEIRNLKRLPLYYDNISKAYKGVGNYKLALENKKIEQLLTDSLNSIEAKIFIAKLETEIKNKEQQTKRILLKKQLAEEKEILLKRNILVLVLLVAIFIAILLVFASIKKAKLSKTLIEKQANLLKIKGEQLVSSAKEVSALKIKKGSERLNIEISETIIEKIGTALKQLRKDLEQDDCFIGDKIEKEVQKLKSAETFVNNLALNLNPTALEKQKLSTAINNYITNVFVNTNIKTNWHCPNPLSLNLLGKDLSLNIYRIIQELLTNIIKHANATEVSVEIYDKKTGIELYVIDNGVGFNKKQQQDGIGLSNIKRRAKQFDGSTNIISKNGTKVFIKMKYNKKQG